MRKARCLILVEDRSFAAESLLGSTCNTQPPGEDYSDESSEDENASGGFRDGGVLERGLDLCRTREAPLLLHDFAWALGAACHGTGRRADGVTL